MGNEEDGEDVNDGEDIEEGKDAEDGKVGRRGRTEWTERMGCAISGEIIVFFLNLWIIFRAIVP